jgi:FkbM family methyltransferase
VKAPASPTTSLRGTAAWRRLEDALWRFPTLRVVHERITKDRLARYQAGLEAVHGKAVELDLFGLCLKLNIQEMHDVLVYREEEERGGYEAGTARIIRALVASPLAFVDVGANNGFFSIAAASVPNFTGHIFAFEPYPNAFSRLEGNIKRNDLGPRVTAYQLAVSDYTGVASLHLSPMEDGRNSLVADFSTTKEVSCTTLDAVLSRTPISLVKIDVEGAELAVFRGMERILSENPEMAVVVEWNRNYCTGELWRFLTDRFDILEIRESRNGRVLRVCQRPPSGIVNLLGVKHGFSTSKLESYVSQTNSPR